MNKRIRKKKARGRTEQHVRALIRKNLTVHNGWSFETTRAKKRRVQQENKALRQERNRIKWCNQVDYLRFENKTDTYTITFTFGSTP